MIGSTFDNVLGGYVFTKQDGKLVSHGTDKVNMIESAWPPIIQGAAVIQFEEDPVDWRKEHDGYGHLILSGKYGNLGDDWEYVKQEGLKSTLEEVIRIFQSEYEKQNDKFLKLEKLHIQLNNSNTDDTFKTVRNMLEQFGLIQPVYVHEHSSIFFHTGPVDTFDSSFAGFFAVSFPHHYSQGHEKYVEHEEYKSVKQMYELCMGELKERTQFVNGEVYSVTYMLRGQDIDHLGGIYSMEDAEEEVKFLLQIES
jgi:hypothetical protein